VSYFTLTPTLAYSVALTDQHLNAQICKYLIHIAAQSKVLLQQYMNQLDHQEQSQKSLLHFQISK